MTNETKIVSLPKEVAEAIEKYLEEFSKEALLRNFCDPKFICWAPRCKALSRIDLDKLMVALVNGYEVELSPEDKVAEYYESLFGANQFDKKEFVLVKTLNLLGIKIPGVNVR